MNRRVKILSLATFLAMGTYMTQLGGCFTMAANNALAAFPVSSLLDENELLFGVFAPCGTPNYQLVDENGIPSGDIVNIQDDLIFFCPVDSVLQATGGGDGGGG